MKRIFWIVALYCHVQAFAAENQVVTKQLGEFFREYRQVDQLFYNALVHKAPLGNKKIDFGVFLEDVLTEVSQNPIRRAFEFIRNGLPEYILNPVMASRKKRTDVMKDFTTSIGNYADFVLAFDAATATAYSDVVAILKPKDSLPADKYLAQLKEQANILHQSATLEAAAAVVLAREAQSSLE